MNKKKELHIKAVGAMYMVCAKEDVWRGYSGLVTREDARKRCAELISNNPDEFLKNYCDCGTDI